MKILDKWRAWRLDEEIENETIGIKTMREDGEQETISQHKLLDSIAEKIGA